MLFFRAGIFLVVASVFLLFQVPRESAEFVVTVLTLVIGAVLAAVLKSVIARRQENREGRLKNAERIGTLFSAGLIVGESLIGVIMAFIIAFSVTNGGSDAPLALNLENWDTAAKWLGLAFFVFGMFVFARRVLKAGR